MRVIKEQLLMGHPHANPLAAMQMQLAWEQDRLIPRPEIRSLHITRLPQSHVTLDTLLREPLDHSAALVPAVTDSDRFPQLVSFAAEPSATPAN